MYVHVGILCVIKLGTMFIIHAPTNYRLQLSKLLEVRTMDDHFPTERFPIAMNSALQYNTIHPTFST